VADQKLIAKGDIPGDEGTKTSRKHEWLVKERQTSKGGRRGEEATTRATIPVRRERIQSANGIVAQAET
jgi:hypothetical protein